MTEENFTTRTLYRGDNLPFLRGMNSGTVDLIATDPPFNKGRDFHATPDSLAAGARFQDRWSWERDVHEEWVDQIKDDWPGVMSVIETARVASGDDMAAFLCFMGVRLIAMRRVLKPTGSIYLHCDPTADYWLRGIMDGVFGRAQFRNVITWKRYRGNRAGATRKFPAVTDSILFYGRSDEALFNGVFTPLDADYVRRAYRHDDGDGRGLYRFGGRIRERKYYLADSRGTPATTLWDDVPELNGTNAEMTGYPTQKPLALYERIIKASSNEGDVVLDPFAGCATTPVAAEKLGRRWVAMDIWEGAHDMVRDRIQNEVRLNGGGGGTR